MRKTTPSVWAPGMWQRLDTGGLLGITDTCTAHQTCRAIRAEREEPEKMVQAGHAIKSSFKPHCKKKQPKKTASRMFFFCPFKQTPVVEKKEDYEYNKYSTFNPCRSWYWPLNPHLQSQHKGCDSVNCDFMYQQVEGCCKATGSCPPVCIANTAPWRLEV